MLYSSIIKKDQDDMVFCIDIDRPLFNYMKTKFELIKNNPDMFSCEFKIDSYRARFGEGEDYDDIIHFPYDPLHGEDPLDYHGVMIDAGTPNQDYWDCYYGLIPEDVYLTIYHSYFSFRFRFGKEFYQSTSINSEDLIKLDWKIV